MTPKFVGGRPPTPEICAQSDRPPFQTPKFPPISAHSASTVRASEKVQLSLIGSRPRAFQRAIDEPCTLPLTPPKGGTKRDFAIFVYQMHFDRLSNHFGFCLSVCVCVCLSVHRSVVERLRPQFFTDFHQILHAAQKCGCFERYSFWDKPEVDYRF